MIITIILCTIITLLSCPEHPSRKDESPLIHAKIDSIRIRHNIPAIAYGVVKNNVNVLQNVIGYRNIHTKEKAELNDLFNLASNTKSFVSFVAGKLVDTGQIEWETKFFDIFPELLESSKSAYHEINLQDLLSHRARLIRFKNESEVYPISDYEKLLPKNVTNNQKRYYFIKQVLQYDPLPLYDHEDDRYSNAGYIAALLMLEKVSNKNWDKLLKQINNDLGIHCHNGWPNSFNEKQPIGHINPREWLIDLDEDLIPIPEVLRKYHYFNETYKLVTPISISVTDFLKFLGLHIQGLAGQDNYLKSSTYKYIFSYKPDYALGWSRKLFNKPFYHHRGGIATFCSIALINPASQIGIVVMYNNHSNKGMDDIVKILAKNFSK